MYSARIKCFNVYISIAIFVTEVRGYIPACHVITTFSKLNHTPTLLASLPFLILSQFVKIALFSITEIRREVLILLTRSVPMPRNSTVQTEASSTLDTLYLLIY